MAGSYLTWNGKTVTVVVVVVFCYPCKGKLDHSRVFFVLLFSLFSHPHKRRM